MTAMRPPAVAGTFYPAERDQLTTVVEAMLAAVPAGHGPAPKAIIAPHAGYIYSGPTAAAVYARLRPARGTVTRVVVIGPSHRVPLRGLALPTVEAFATPLGPLPVDRAAVGRLRDLPQVVEADAPHAMEHSLEVHLPFIKAVLGDVALVPLVAGQCTPEDVAAILDVLWGGPETVIVVSSDLSHYLDYETCRRVDAGTVAAIERLDPGPIGFDNACGRLPIAGLLTVARARGLRVETVDVRNSGDTAGPRDRVVGYGAWAFCEDGDEARADGDEEQIRTVARAHGTDMLMLAAASIRHGLREGRPLPLTVAVLPQALRAPAATFVTLTRNGDRALRGCIGSAHAWRPLGLDLADNAYKAAFGDPRFPPLQPAEIGDLGVAVSVLTTPRPLAVADEAGLLRCLRPGVDGLILEDGGRRGLFLPSVWEALPDPHQFVAHLKLKAGLPPDHWSPTLRVARFTTEIVRSAVLPEPDPKVLEIMA